MLNLIKINDCNNNKDNDHINNKHKNLENQIKVLKIKKLNIDKKNNHLKKITKSLGHIIITKKKEKEKNKSQIHYNFYKIFNSLNKVLNLSDLVKQSQPRYKKLNLKSIFSPKLLDKIKKEKYNKKWHFNETYNIITPKSKNNIKLDSSEKSNSEKNETNKIYEISFLNKKKTPKRLLPPKEIVKICKRKIYKNNKLMNYSLYLNNNIDYYIECQDQYRGFYDFDKQLRHMIKDNQIGIDYPGNFLQRNVLSYIKTFNPKNITSKHTKNYSVPDRTFLPIPQGLKNIKYTHITKREIYNYKNKLY